MGSDDILMKHLQKRIRGGTTDIRVHGGAAYGPYNVYISDNPDLSGDQSLSGTFNTVGYNMGLHTQVFVGPKDYVFVGFDHTNADAQSSYKNIGGIAVKNTDIDFMYGHKFGENLDIATGLNYNKQDVSITGENNTWIGPTVTGFTPNTLGVKTQAQYTNGRFRATGDVTVPLDRTLHQDSFDPDNRVNLEDVKGSLELEYVVNRHFLDRRGLINTSFFIKGETGYRQILEENSQDMTGNKSSAFNGNTITAGVRVGLFKLQP